MWLKAWNSVKRVLGKVKAGVQAGARLFNKGKEMYRTGKNIAVNLPYIGEAASKTINDAETRANKYAKDRIGVDFRDVDRAVSTADRLANYLPSG